MMGFIRTFLEGLASFLSPCILPLVPAYISFISGISLDEIEKKQKGAVATAVVNSLLFILGFSTVFVLMGATSTFIGGLLKEHKSIIARIGGVIIIIFGLHLTGIFKLKFLDVEKKFHLQSKPAGIIGSFLVGVVFSVGWSPCVGPFLGAAIAEASQSETVWHGMGLLLSFSMGLGIPFFLTSLFLSAFFSFFKGIRKYMRIISIASGVLLVFIGLLLLTGHFLKFSRYFSGLGV